MLFNGNYISNLNLPYDYIFFWILISTPIFYIVLFALGYIETIKNLFFKPKMCYYLIMSQDLDLSFVIVTNGNRDGLLHTIIDGIRYQKIPQYEIIIIGYSRIDRRLYPEGNYIEAKDLAEAG